MKLALATWREVEAYLLNHDGIILPVGSTEQHGPIGLIGTDALCAETIAERAADLANAYVAPTLAYTPAPFNMAFPGTLSVSVETFSRLASEIVEGLATHGFHHIYILNAHGANVEPLTAIAKKCTDAAIRIQSWWDFPAVNDLRKDLYGDWEGMHATPSEVSITQAFHRVVDADDPDPPAPLPHGYLEAHSGDRHGPPDEHRRQFPDGRVGSHSGLARPEHGRQLVQLAAEAVAKDFNDFLKA